MYTSNQTVEKQTSKFYSFAMAQTYQLDHGEVLQLMCFADVQNSGEVVAKLANAVYPFDNCTIINLKLILDPFQILIAANKAVVAKYNNTMITKSLPTELLFNLSTSDNITESLNKFGYGSSCENEFLLAVFGNDNEQQKVISSIHGSLQPLSSLNEKCDVDLIQKVYDVTKEQVVNNLALNIIVTKIACKSV